MASIRVVFLLSEADKGRLEAAAKKVRRSVSSFCASVVMPAVEGIVARDQPVDLFPGVEESSEGA